MGSPEELHQAIVILGSTLFASSDDLNHFIWDGYPHELAAAKNMFRALCWVVGSDENGMQAVLDYINLKTVQYLELEQELEQKEKEAHA